jgi:hypothetical protein
VVGTTKLNHEQKMPWGRRNYLNSTPFSAACRAVSEKPAWFCQGREAQIHTLRAYDTRSSPNRQED